MDFGRLVCESLAMDPEIVRSIVIEIYPDSGLTITLEIPSDCETVQEWAKAEELKNPGRVTLMEIGEWNMD